MKICAGIVLYNPDIDRLKQNIDSIIKQVEIVCIIDNCSENNVDILKLVSCYGDYSLKYIRNDENKGIAFALNEIMIFAEQNDCLWFITLDQDSVCVDGLLLEYKMLLSNEIGQITCNIIDKNGGILDDAHFANEKYKEVEYCITSGCINNLKALKEVGGYDESLFIDGVDIDVSCKLKKQGYRIVCVNYDGLLHELGSGETRVFLGKKVNVSQHVPWRNYYTRRNLIYVYRKYYSGISRIKLIFKQIIYGIGIVLLEDKKIERIKFNFIGIRDGLLRKI